MAYRPAMHPGRGAELPKSFHIKSYGCQMNVYDGDRMAETLTAEGMVAAARDEADLVVLNTCHIREKAREKVSSDIGRLKRADGRNPMIALAGCVAQAEGAEIARRSPSVSLVVGPQAYHRLPALVAEAARGGSAIDIDMPAVSKFELLPPRRRSAPSAFLTVQEGCDKFCTYCVVPYTRGAETSRPMRAILDEAKALVDGGAREIVLLGQNVNGWRGSDGSDGRGRTDGLGGLIAALDRVQGIERIRYTTSHPCDMTEDLVRAHAGIERLMPFLHLPVQSGSDRILKAMNRSHDVDFYRRTIERVRAARPDIAVSGDFIVGFPGETDADFEDTLRVVQETRYAQAYSFKYSARPGTPAAAMAEQVPPALMDERLKRLQAAIGETQLAFNRAVVGRRTQILVERPGRRPGQVIGRTPWMQSTHVESRACVGDLIEVDIASAGPNSLSGRCAALQPVERAA